MQFRRFSLLFVFVMAWQMTSFGQSSPWSQAEKVEACKARAEAGSIDSQRALAAFYQVGIIVGERDLQKAAYWYLRAAKQGDVSSQFDIGKCYAYGEGVPQDYVEAYKWFNIVAASKDVNLNDATNYLDAKHVEELKKMWVPVPDMARKERNQLAMMMTPEQIAEGQRRASAFVPKPERANSSTNSNLPTTENVPNATGTGFFITDDGYFISNNHVVKGATKIRVVTSAGTIDAKIIQTDAANDLALLKTEGKFSGSPVAPSRKVKLGAMVATVGFPDPGLQGFSPKLAKGEIAALAGAADDARYFQISVPVQPGNSGGALVDERGNVVGIVSAKLSAKAALESSGALPENVNYAVKSSFLLSFLESVPEVSAKLKDPLTMDRKFEDVVKSAQDAAVLVLVY
jgi:S1-C subfamily serine protease